MINQPHTEREYLHRSLSKQRVEVGHYQHGITKEYVSKHLHPPPLSMFALIRSSEEIFAVNGILINPI